MTPLLEVHDLRIYFISRREERVVKAVEAVSFALHEGETLGLVGESGSGKTTVCLSILRLLPPGAQIVGGEVRFEGEDLLRKTDREMSGIRGKRISMILQDPMVSLNPLYSIGRQVGESLRVREGLRRKATTQRVRDLLAAVRIPAPESRLHDYPHQMSGGMRQRIVGAIAISCRPRLLLADEPTTSLDLTTQAEYLDLLKDLQRQHGLAMLFVTHNLGIVAKMCDQVAVMYAGRFVEYGPVREIFNAPAHPYTRALLESIPQVGDLRVRLTAIEGQPPDLAALPPGCPFHPRCPKAEPRCAHDEPPDVQVGDAHVARCWLIPSPTPASGAASS